MSLKIWDTHTERGVMVAQIKNKFLKTRDSTSCGNITRVMSFPSPLARKLPPPPPLSHVNFSITNHSTLPPPSPPSSSCSLLPLQRRKKSDVKLWHVFLLYHILGSMARGRLRENCRRLRTKAGMFNLETQTVSLFHVSLYYMKCSLISML